MNPTNFFLMHLSKPFLILSSHLRLGFQINLIRSGSRTNTLCIFLLFHSYMCAGGIHILRLIILKYVATS
jgi:hypothetical protein